MKKIKGFTMIEMIVVITLTTILASSFYYFIKRPMLAYSNIKERSVLVDEAYSIIYRLKKDIQSSLPNSVRVTTNGGITYLEMITLTGAGKYRSQLTNTGTGDVLDFTLADTTFDVVSNPVTINANNFIVIANLGFTGFDAYNADNRSLFTGTPGTNISNVSITAKKFPLISEYDKFYIVNNVITYACNPTTKRLIKYEGYGIQTTQPNDISAVPLSTANQGVLSTNISNCQFFNEQGSSSRNGFVGLSIQLNNNQQNISLYGETYVPNN